MTVTLRAALYLRVSTARQMEHDVSIPDQKRQGEGTVRRVQKLVETAARNLKNGTEFHPQSCAAN
jgi:site-specific DNA recombinase